MLEFGSSGSHCGLPCGRPSLPTEHGAFGNWSSSGENGAPRSRAPKAPASTSPAQYCPGPGRGPAPQAPSSSLQAAGWDARVAEVMDKEEMGSLSYPLEGWPREEQFRPTSVGRCVRSDLLFTNGVGPTTKQATRSDSDIMTRASTLGGAVRLPAGEFWALIGFGGTEAVLRGRDFAVRSSQQRPLCA